MKFRYLSLWFCATLILATQSCKKDDKSPDQDSSCQLISIESFGQHVSFRYDESGRVAEVGGDLDHTLTYESGRILITEGDYTDSYRLNEEGLVTESILYTENGQPFTGTYTYEDGYLKQIEYDGEAVYHATITFEYENGNISNIIHWDEFIEEPQYVNVTYQNDQAYVPYSLLAAEDALVFWEQEMLLYEQGYMGKVIKNRIETTTVDELVYTEDERGNVVTIENIAVVNEESPRFFNYEYSCE